jgi:hypothetical protein
MLVKYGRKFHADLKGDDFSCHTNKEVKPKIADIVNVLERFENLRDEL